MSERAMLVIGLRTYVEVEEGSSLGFLIRMMFAGNQGAQRQSRTNRNVMTIQWDRERLETLKSTLINRGWNDEDFKESHAAVIAQTEAETGKQIDWERFIANMDAFNRKVTSYEIID